jgi:transposase
MAYSLDFRKQAIAYMDRGHTFAELKEAFNIFPSTLNAWRRLLNETGELRPRPIPGRPPTIDIPALKADINAKPDAYLRELAEPHGCSANAVWLALKRHGITYKKNVHLS